MFSENVLHGGDNHSDHSRTETSDDLESDFGKATKHGRSCCIAQALAPRVQRILAAYRKEGAAAVVHRTPGRKAKHRIGDAVRQQVITLAQEPYSHSIFTQSSEATEVDSLYEWISVSLS